MNKKTISTYNIIVYKEKFSSFIFIVENDLGKQNELLSFQ